MTLQARGVFESQSGGAIMTGAPPIMKPWKNFHFVSGERAFRCSATAGTFMVSI